MPSIKQLQTDKLEIKKRAKKTLIKYAVIFGIALIYLVFVLITGIGIPCIFNKVTGLRCVGCGISRMLVSIVKLDFVSAFKYNAFLFVTGPILIAYFAISEVRYVSYGTKEMGKWDIILYVELALAILYGILRNIFPI